jgi:hypothetical protein
MIDHQSRYLELSVEIRDTALSILGKYISAESYEMVVEDYQKWGERWWLEANIHFHWGRAVRNLLRQQGIPDNQLPSGNWDDYYLPLIEVMAGCRNRETGEPEPWGTSPSSPE